MDPNVGDADLSGLLDQHTRVTDGLDVPELPLQAGESPRLPSCSLVVKSLGCRLPTQEAVIHCLPRVWNPHKGLTIRFGCSLR